jgi:hypothetical protein
MELLPRIRTQRIEKISIPVLIERMIQKSDVVHDIEPIYDNARRILNETEYLASRRIVRIPGKKYITNNPEYFDTKLEYLQLINPFREKMEDEFIGGMPIQLEGRCCRQLLRVNQRTNQLVYSVTLKVDGERFLMFINKDSNVYLVDRSTNLFKFNFSLSVDLKNTILDGELVHHADGSYEYLIFDILFYNGESVMQKDWNRRYIESQKALNSIKSLKGFVCSLKLWFPITEILKSNNMYKHITNLTNQSRKTNKLVADGIIFQPNDTSYIAFREWNGYNNVQFKWKPPEKLTIDFKIKKISDKKWILLTSTDEPYNITQQKGKPLPAMCMPSKQDNQRYGNGEVVEFRYKSGINRHKNLFIPEKSRNEKRANGYRTIMSTLYAIEEKFEIESMKPAFESITKGPVTDLSNILNYFTKSDLILWSLYYKKQMFFNEDDIESIKPMYEKLSKNLKLEFECRIYNYTKPKGKAQTGPVVMNKSVFFYLLDFCYQNFPMESDNTIDVYVNDKSNNKFRSTYRNFEDIYSGNSISNLEKYAVKSYVLTPSNPSEKNYNNLNMKIALSKEEPIDDVIGLKSVIDGGKTVQNNIRIKTRKMFKVNESWRIDFTRIKTSYDISDILEKNEILELEIEFINKSIPSFDEFIVSLNDLYMIILSNSGYC